MEKTARYKIKRARLVWAIVSIMHMHHHPRPHPRNCRRKSRDCLIYACSPPPIYAGGSNSGWGHHAHSRRGQRDAFSHSQGSCRKNRRRRGRERKVGWSGKASRRGSPSRAHRVHSALRATGTRRNTVAAGGIPPSNAVRLWLGAARACMSALTHIDIHTYTHI